MEFRVLQYFLAVAREENISGAAEFLHLSQPTLSRQLKELEEELGKQLFIRGNRKITLTEEGMLLRKRAEEIVDLMKKTESEIALSDETAAGNIYIGAAEAEATRYLIQAAKSLQNDYPLIHFHIVSGDRRAVMEQLDKGLIDFALLHENMDAVRYETIAIPYKNEWGLLMRRDAPLAEKKFITAEDLKDLPIIVSRQILQNAEFQMFQEKDEHKFRIVATYNLLYNGSLMVEEGMGYALCFDKIINTSGDSKLCFRPLMPKRETSMAIIWKRYQIFSTAAQKFLEKLQEEPLIELADSSAEKGV